MDEKETNWTEYYLEILKKELAEKAVKSELQDRDKVRNELNVKQKAAQQKLSSIDAKIEAAQIEHNAALNEGAGDDGDFDGSIDRATNALAKLQTLGRLREKLDVNFPELSKKADETQDLLNRNFQRQLAKLNNEKLTPEIQRMGQKILDRTKGFEDAVREFAIGDLKVDLPTPGVSTFHIADFFK